MSERKPLIVGQSLGVKPGSTILEALLPTQANSPGDRLRNFMGITKGEYVAWFDRTVLVDMVGKEFTMKDAKEAAEAKRATGMLADRKVLYLGKAVAKAFGFPTKTIKPFVWQNGEAYIPHPGKKNEDWDDAQTMLIGRYFLGGFADHARLVYSKGMGTPLLAYR